MHNCSERKDCSREPSLRPHRQPMRMNVPSHLISAASYDPTNCFQSVNRKKFIFPPLLKIWLYRRKPKLSGEGLTPVEALLPCARHETQSLALNRLRQMSLFPFDRGGSGMLGDHITSQSQVLSPKEKAHALAPWSP